MSVKQQHRIAALNRQQIETPPARLSDALENRITALQDNERSLRLQLQLSRELIATLQRDKERLIAERDEQAGIARFCTRLAARCRSGIKQYRDKWQHVSRLLRLLPPGKVSQLRELDTMHFVGHKG